ncbi:cytochrome c oxidase subunit II [Ferroacidibacillus organovorans]|nr:cytochrome c oxidase subunit II [Ferroacidibacillus organovorans]
MTMYGFIRRSVQWMALLFCGLSTTGCSSNVLVFHPAGPVSRIEEHLIIMSIILVTIVVVPVILLLWYIVRTFRDTPNNPAPYEPEWSESRVLESIWWGIPIIIVAVLGFFTVKDTFALTRPPEKVTNPLTILVTSLDWKWMFQYPGQQVATVNYCEIPASRPVQFVLTSNAPMNSFWVPELGGQEYTMPGMAMRLWLQADQPGIYYGHGANFSGKGFAHMQFNVHAVKQTQFDAWVKHLKRTAPPLTMDGYHGLVRPSVVGQMSFSSYPPTIFRDMIMQEGGMYMKHDMTILGTAD